MHEQDDIQRYHDLLTTRRDRLARLLQQQTDQRAGDTSPDIVADITTTRAEIQRLKALLQANGTTVDDQPNDAPASANQTTQTGGVHFGMGNRIDRVDDVIGGDQIGGDKVGGDKITHNWLVLFWGQAWIPFLAVIALVLLFVITSIITSGANAPGFIGTLRAAGLLPPAPISTPTVTPVLTSTPVPTTIPTPTIEPLLFAPERSGETLIVIVPFFRTEGVMDTDEAHTIQRRIRDDLKRYAITDVRVETVEDTQVRAEDHTAVTALAQRYQASLIVWGSNTGVEVLVHFLNLRQPDVDAADVSLQETGEQGRTQIANPQAYADFITQDLPATMTFLSLFAVGQSSYIREDYVAATSMISASLDALSGVAPLPEGTADAYFRLGWLYHVPGQDISDAERAYTQAITLDPTYVSAYNNRGILYHKLRHLEQALNDYNQAIALNPNEASVYLNRGAAYYVQQHLEQALADYNQAIALNPNEALAYTGRGNVYYGQHELEKALADYSRTIALDPTASLAYYNRGTVYYDQHELEKALTDYTKAIALEKALTDYTKALAFDPTIALAYVARGDIYYDQHELEKALADYTEAIALDPTIARAYRNRGLVYYDQQELEKALADYTEAIARDTTDAYTYNNRGLVYRALQELEKALADYTEAIALDPTDAHSYFNRGIVYYNQQHLEQALADYNKAIDLDPNYARAYNNRGNVYRDQHELEKALADYNKAIDLDPTASLAYYNRGILYQERNKRNAAIADFQKARDLFTNPQDIQDAKDRLKELGAE